MRKKNHLVTSKNTEEKRENPSVYLQESRGVATTAVQDGPCSACVLKMGLPTPKVS